eukprot:10410376-Karenia_brevis.AAC.1
MTEVRDFIKNVEWEGKDDELDAMAGDIFVTQNHIKSIAQLGKIDPDKMVWPANLSGGHRAYCM